MPRTAGLCPAPIPQPPARECKMRRHGGMWTWTVTEVMEGKLTSKDAVERGVQLWNTMRQDFERTQGTSK